MHVDFVLNFLVFLQQVFFISLAEFARPITFQSDPFLEENISRDLQGDGQSGKAQVGQFHGK